MTYLFSFLVPAICWIFSCFASKIFPMGENIIYFSDMEYQYAGYFEFIQNILQNGASPFFSLYKGMGEETLGMIVYYMMSPFNLIVGLFPKENITEAVLLINLLKIGACGLTFSIFLKNKFKQNNIFAIIAFSTCYALMAYNIAYEFNIMWLDGVVWLPIIILGIDRLIEKDRSDLFYISLTIAILSNWYIGFMLCVFSGLYFFYSMISSEDYLLCRRLLKKFVLFGILSAGTALIVIIPAFVTVMSEVKRSIFEEASFINYTFIDILSKFVFGAFDFKEITDQNYSDSFLNLPNLYCGITALFLFVVYFFNDKIDKKARVKDGIFGIVLLVMTLYMPLNRIWHVFATNVWFPYRYSFCLSFYMLFIAYKSLINIEKIELKKIFKICIGMILIYFIIEKLNYSFIKTECIHTSVLILLASYIAIRLSNDKNKFAILALMLIMCFDIGLNTLIYMQSITYANRTEFYEEREKLVSKIEEVKNMDLGCYRIEENITKDENTSIGQEYFNITSSSTMGKEAPRGLLEALGFSRVVNNSVGYNDDCTRFVKNFLGIKYYLTNDEINTNYEALSLGFTIGNYVKNINNFIVQWGGHSNSFEKINELVGEELYKNIEISKVEIENFEVQGENDYKKLNSNDAARYIIYFEVPTEDTIYFKADWLTDADFSLYVDDEYVCEYFSIEKSGVVKLGKFEVGETVKITLEDKNDEEITASNSWVYYEDDFVYTKIMSDFSTEQVNMYDVTSSSLEGEIEVINDDKALLFTIPYDKYLSVYIDGKKVETYCILDSLLGVDISKGEHSIKVVYEPSYLWKVAIFSSLFMVLAIVVIIYEKRKV